MVKKVYESTNKDLSYIEEIQKNIHDEVSAIASYENLLKNNNLTPKIREVIEEIKSDEQEHLSLLSSILENQVEDTFGKSDEFDI